MTRFLLFCCLLAAGMLRAQVSTQDPYLQDPSGNPRIYSNTAGTTINLYEIRASAEAYWKDRERFKKGSGFKPYMRWDHYWSHMMNTRGELPTSSQFWESWKTKSSLTARTPNPTAAWNPIGPEEVGVFSGRLPGTGRLNAVAVDPNNENIWYVGAPAGGIWKSTDAGQNWSNLFDDFPQIGVSGIAIDPNDSNTIYITTGDDDAADSYSIGVFKSTDGGQSWNETGGPLNPSGTNANILLNEVVIDPTNSNIVWVAGSTGLYKSTNAGASWNRVQTGYISDFKLKPGSPNTVYAVANGHIGGGGNRTTFYKTENGVDFDVMQSAVLPTSAGRVVLGVTPANPEVLYILAAETAQRSFRYQGFYKSENSGQTFSESPNNTNIMESSQAWFDLALEVSPTDANVVYMGCLNIWKSLNGGNNWFRLNQWFVNNEAYTHADIHTLKFFNDKLYAATDGGIYVSENDGTTFSDQTAGMAIGQFYKLVSLSCRPIQNDRWLAGQWWAGPKPGFLEQLSWRRWHGQCDRPH